MNKYKFLILIFILLLNACNIVTQRLDPSIEPPKESSLLYGSFKSKVPGMCMGNNVLAVWSISKQKEYFIEFAKNLTGNRTLNVI